MAKSAGYHTAYFGKLGIGYTETAELIESYGFDTHCGLYDSVICWGYYPEYYWENGKKVLLPTNPKFDRATPHCPMVGEEEMVYSEDIWLEKCKDWLRQRAEEKEPFFAIYATQLPHGPASIAPKDYVFNDRAEWTPKERVYASMMQKLDRSVGELTDQLDQLGMADNTIVIFMGDNGHEPDSYTCHDPAGMLNGFWDGHQRGEDRFDGTLGQRGVKRNNHEGGLNVPFMIRWPGRIAPGSQSPRRTAVYDILPTLAAVEQGIPVIAVRENRNCMRNDLQSLPFTDGKLIIVDNYLEATGVLAAMKGGVSVSSVRRPLAPTVVECEKQEVSGGGDIDIRKVELGDRI